MAELFMRVWFLCAIAFLAGSAVTWLLFVRTPKRRWAAQLPFVPAPRPRKGGAHRSHRVEAAAPQHPPPTEPALANLDTKGGEPAGRRLGSSAAGALDRLGVAGGPSVAAGEPDTPQPTPEIPNQSGPVDEPSAGEER